MDPREELDDAPLIILDRPRRWVMDLNAQIALGEALGMNVFDGPAMTKLVNAPHPRHVRAMVWAGLIREDPSLTLEQVGAMLRTPKQIYALSRTIMRHYAGVSTPDPAGPMADDASKAPKGESEGVGLVLADP